MAIPDASETSQTEGEGPDGSDKPPHNARKSQPTSPNKSRPKSSQKPSPNKVALDVNTVFPVMLQTTDSVPLPSPEAGAYPKEPGNTRLALEKLMLAGGKPQDKHSFSSTFSRRSSVNESPSPSECDSYSLPSTRPPSQAPSRASSRAPSMSAGVSGGKVATPKGSAKKEPEPSTFRPRAPSVGSTDGSHKFTLKDLLSNAPKLGRRSSVRSNGSSKKSDSDNGDAKSNAGSATSLTKKYGVCQKVAIGKGATSIVRLAHKWDRSEEKLYAVKVCKLSYENRSSAHGLFL